MIDGVPLGWIISVAVLFAIVYWRVFSFKGGSDTPKPPIMKFDDKDEEIKQGAYLADEGGELLTDEEEKQVWEEFQGKVEEDK